MITTLADPRLIELWRRRKIEQENLGCLRLYRSSVCGCSRCGDQSQGDELDGHIRDCLARLAKISDAICTRS
jgi:hypothetical protein